LLAVLVCSLKRVALLDIIKATNDSATYGYGNNKDHQLIIIKKCPVWSKGFDEPDLLKPLSHKYIAKIYGAFE